MALFFPLGGDDKNRKDWLRAGTGHWWVTECIGMMLCVGVHAWRVSSEEAEGSERKKSWSSEELLLFCCQAVVLDTRGGDTHCGAIWVWIVSGGGSSSPVMMWDLPEVDSDLIKRMVEIFPGLCLHPSDASVVCSPAGSVDRERPLHYHQRLWGCHSTSCPWGPLHSQRPRGHLLLPSYPR